MVSPSNKKLNQSEDDEQQNSQCTKSARKHINTSEVNGNCQTKNSGLIYLDYSMEIVDPRNTPLKWYPNDNDIKVLIISEVGCQVLVVFTGPKSGKVQDIITPLAYILKNKIIHILLVTDPVNNVRYVIKVFSNPNIVGHINNESFTEASMHGAKKLSNSNHGSCTNGSKNESTIFMQESSMCLKRSLQVLTVYPTPPCKGSVEITLDDLKCLDKDQHLNDIIINFYLNYLVLETLALKDQERIHLFSSFFYTRLTNFRQTSMNRCNLLDKSESAETQHAKVKRWTKYVNIFEKDFVIIPINENEHWFLTIICYPNMIGVQSNHSGPHFRSQCPSILIFESIPALKFKRSEVAQTLKNYVRCEYKAKFGKDCGSLKHYLEVGFPDVPKQYNSSDCGLYLLQYAEHFFKDYVTGHELSLSLQSLGNWFDVDVIQGKRGYLKKLIIQLANGSQVFKKRRTV